MLEYKDFKSNLLKLNGPRKHKVNNSIGSYDAYKYIRKNKWGSIETPLSEHIFYSIIRNINLKLANSLVLGNPIVLPERMGTLELRKYDGYISIKNNKIITNLPVDWDKTLKLWYEDKDSFNEKRLIRLNEKEIFKVYYNKNKANFINKIYYEFIINKELKHLIKNNIKDGNIEAPSLKKSIMYG